MGIIDKIFVFVGTAAFLSTVIFLVALCIFYIIYFIRSRVKKGSYFERWMV